MKSGVHLIEFEVASSMDPMEKLSAVIVAPDTKVVLIHRPIIVEASNDDNSVVALHHATMDRLKLFRGDTVELTGRKDCMHCARGCHV